MSLAHGGNIIALARENGWDWRDVIDFSASINPLGPSPAVRAAIVRNLDRIAHYPEREPSRLIAALARLWNINDQQILLGNGATELIFFLARTIKTQHVALALPVFSEFHRAFPQASTVDLQTPETWSKEGLLVLTRPANPLGSTIPFQALRAWLAGTENPVLIDESFLDFSEEPSAASLLDEHPRLMILRSLTKFYALPGLRIGALLGNSATVADWKHNREPWQVNVLAEEAALAALADDEHSERSLTYIKSERAWLLSEIEVLPGAKPLPSDANFLYVQLEYPAQKLYEFLLQRRLIVRVCTNWPGLSREAVRVAVRTRTENETLIEEWKQFSCVC